LTQILGFLRIAPSALPRKVIANHSEEEKRDKPEKCLKSKIGSPLIRQKLVRMSENTLMKKIANPKNKPTISPSTESNIGKIAITPPSMHTPKSSRIMILPDGRENSDEYRSTSLSMYLSRDLLDAT